MNIFELLTDKSNCPNVRFLEVEGLKATQSSKVIDLLKKLRKERFEIAIEIGTQQGGFSLLLKEILKCDVHTWDIIEYHPADLKKKLFKQNNINYRIEDCFEDSTLDSLLLDKRKKILFCDGGHKSNEFNYFADFLNKGDFIGGHDYFETVEDRDNDVWTTCELVHNDIKPAIEKNNLKPVYTELSLNSVWALYQKL